VIFPGANGSFNWVGIGQGVQEFGIVLSNEGFDVFGGLIVQFVQLGSIAMELK
jgi:hypothetical protein